MRLHKDPLDASVNGAAIQIFKDDKCNQLIHTGSALDEIWIYAQNRGIEAARITISFEGRPTIKHPKWKKILGLKPTITENKFMFTHVLSEDKTLYPIIPGLYLGKGETVKACASSDEVFVMGWTKVIEE